MNNIIKLNQYGGKLVGQGTYGCVFRPMIPCKGNNERRKGYVSKVMTKDEAESEYNETKEIDRIDPHGEFHLLGPEMCNIDKKHHNEPGMDKCKPIKGVNKANIGILQYRDGGTDLHNFLNTVKKDKDMKFEITKKLLRGLRTFFIGLDIMWKNKYIHSDIKLKNMVINPETMICKYIDFGLFTRMDNLDNIDFMFTELYFPHPSELLYIKLYNGTQLSPEQFNVVVDNIHSKVKKNRTYHTKINNENVFNGNIYDISFTPDKTAFYRNIMRTHTKEQFRQLLCEKIDVHSLGVSLMRLYVNVTDTLFNLKPSRKYSPIKQAFHSLILSLIEPQFNRRPNGKQAYNLYMKSLWPLIQPTVTKPGGGGGKKSKKAAPKPKPKKAAPKPKLKKAAPKPKSKQAAPKPKSKQAAPKPKHKKAAPKPKPKKAAPKPKSKQAAPKPKSKQAAPKRECRVNTRTNRCSMKGTVNPELCTLSDHNRCRKKKQHELKKARPAKSAPKKAKPKRASSQKTTNVTQCKGKTKSQCKTLPNCKYVDGEKRQFCRKSRNKRRNKKSGGGGRKV
jgi:serine/threonine protein kinase